MSAHATPAGAHPALQEAIDMVCEILTKDPGAYYDEVQMRVWARLGERELGAGGLARESLRLAVVSARQG